MTDAQREQTTSILAAMLVPVLDRRAEEAQKAA
jgi:hypothetical protein